MNGGFNIFMSEITPDLIRPADMQAIIGFTPEELCSPDKGHSRADALVHSCNEVGREAHGKVVITYAYDSDPREIYEISQVNEHIRYLFNTCPHLFYFLHPDLQFTRGLLLSLYGAFVLSASNGTAQVGIRDIASARALSKQLQSDVTAYAQSIGDRLGGLEAANAIKSLGI